MWSSSPSNPSAGTYRSKYSVLFSLRARLFGAVLGAGLCLGAGDIVGAPPPYFEAESVLLEYFAALQAGDVGALERLLGGELKASRLRLLRNPEYTFELVRDYGVAEFRILDLQRLDSGDMAATVDTWLQPSEKLSYRLTMRRGGLLGGFQIVASEVVP